MSPARKSTPHNAPPSNHTTLAEQLEKKYPPITIKEIQKYKVDKKDWIMGKGFVRRGAPTLLTGGTGIGKSVMAMQMAVSKTTGKPFLGRMDVGRRGKVFYLNAQNDMETLKRDVTSICAGMGVDIKEIGDRLDIRYVPSLPSVEFHLFFRRVISRTKPDLVIVDPYQDFIGSKSTKDEEAFFDWRDKVTPVIRDYGCGLLLLPHTKKPQEKDVYSDREMVYMAIGTSAIANWCRCSCELLHDKDDPTSYFLHFSKNAERTGIRDKGRVVRKLFVRHSNSEDEPCWFLCESQVGTVKVNKEAIVIEAAYKNPKMSYRLLAEHLGMNKNDVYKFYPKDLKVQKAKEKREGKSHAKTKSKKG